VKQELPKMEDCASGIKAVPGLKTYRSLVIDLKTFVIAMICLFGVFTAWSSRMCFAEDHCLDCDASQSGMVKEVSKSSIKPSEKETLETFNNRVGHASHLDHKTSQNVHITDKNDHTNPVWGKIVDSPTGILALYREKDLGYIRCADAKRGMVREGDRFGIVAGPATDLRRRTIVNPLDSKNMLLGQIEITSAGSDLIMGIILECRTLIHNGYQIAPLLQTTVEQSNLPDIERILSMDGLKS